MCGRYQITDDKDIEEINKILHEINNKYNSSGLTAKTGEIYPTNIVPILTLENQKPIISLMKWGFPKWDNKGVTINAKSETASEKKMFSKSLAEKRCVILATGFYEWNQTTKEKTKEKYLFKVNTEMLYMAGIYNVFATTEQIQERFVIFTCEANESIRDIHNRMPVILNKNELMDWLRDDSFTSFVFQRNNIMLNRDIIAN